MHMLLLLCVSVHITHLLAVVLLLLLLHLQPLWCSRRRRQYLYVCTSKL